MAIEFFFSVHQKKFCLLRKEGKNLFIEKMGEFSKNVKQLDIPEGKKLKIVTGLPSKDVILRKITLKLKSKREILSALPFQVESILPYPSDQLILLPTLHPKEEQTEISLLATSSSALKEHLEKEGDSDIVSCVPLALFRYASHFFPELESFFLHHEETFIVVEKNQLCASQAIQEKDLLRILTLMQKKYPHISQDPIHTGKHWEYAITIGLALDAAKKDDWSGQFRQKENLSKKQQKRKKKLLLSFLSSCSCFILFTLTLGHFYFKNKERTFLKTLGYTNSKNLSEVVHQLEEQLYKQKKSTVSVSPLPKISILLTWLSTHPKLQEDCSITRFRYQLVKFPRIGTQIKTYSAKIELELTSLNPRAAHSFYESLLQDTKIVDQKNPIRWNADQGIYKAAFYVKPQKL